MTASASVPLRRPVETAAAFATMLLRRERRLALAGCAALALMAPTLVAFASDGRTLDGVSVWLKPLKFQASIGLYLLTLAWFFGALPERVRRGRVAGALVAVAVAASAFELAYIMLQAGRGLASHYNIGDPFHRTMYTLMGVGAVLLTGVSPALAVLLARHRPPQWPTPFWIAVLLGLCLTFVLGAGAGAVLSAGDGHWIGGSRSDAGGVPIFGWSRQGGDLRIAHFLGMHTLQVLPVVGLLAARRIEARTATLAVAAAALAYAGVTVFAFVQALRGVPLVPA